MSRLVDLTGKRFGRLFVIERMGNQSIHAYWKCRCDCGTEKAICSTNLIRKRQISCGCLKKERTSEMGINNRKHGHCSSKNGKVNWSKTYITWCGMIKRCRDIKNHNYLSYGGRGIIVCNEWKDFSNFLRDMGERPDGTSLDRINSDGNYEPLNCRWASFRQQTANRNKEVYIKNLFYDTKSGFSVDITKQNNVFL
jgi:hypothetical protein